MLCSSEALGTRSNGCSATVWKAFLCDPAFMGALRHLSLIHTWPRLHYASSQNLCLQQRFSRRWAPTRWVRKVAAFSGPAMTAERTPSIRSLCWLIRCAPLDGRGRSLKQSCQWQTWIHVQSIPRLFIFCERHYHIQRATSLAQHILVVVLLPNWLGRVASALRLQVSNDFQPQAQTS
jgi:hypothetical protein